MTNSLCIVQNDYTFGLWALGWCAGGMLPTIAGGLIADRISPLPQIPGFLDYDTNSKGFLLSGAISFVTYYSTLAIEAIGQPSCSPSDCTSSCVLTGMKTGLVAISVLSGALLNSRRVKRVNIIPDDDSMIPKFSFNPLLFTATAITFLGSTSIDIFQPAITILGRNYVYQWASIAAGVAAAFFLGRRY